MLLDCKVGMFDRLSLGSLLGSTLGCVLLELILGCDVGTLEFLVMG
jgi:hypothetical protein